MGFAVDVEADLAVGRHGCDDGVGDGLSGDEVQVRRVGSGAAGVDGDVAAVVVGFAVDDGDVEGDGGDAAGGDAGGAEHGEFAWCCGAVERADLGARRSRVEQAGR